MKNTSQIGKNGKMKKGVIISIYDTSNYGNRLQNYAVARVLGKLGVQTVNYRSQNAPFKRVGYLYILAGVLYYGLIKRSFGQAERFAGRKLVDIKLCRYIYTERTLKRKAHKYDYFICGSDQIWNPYFAGKDYYFAHVAPREKRIAYSASFGVDEIPENSKPKYETRLNEMKAISVRESQGAKIVKDLINLEVPVLVDPTLMLGREEWRELARKPKFDTSKKYILTYILGHIPQEVAACVATLCEEQNLALIDLNALHPNRYWNKTTCLEFVWLIEHAQAVFTDSFHGSVFSILMKTPFVVFDRIGSGAKMNSRIDTLLKTFQLENRRFDGMAKEDIMQAAYTHTEEILQREREKATDFLKKAMEIE